MRPMRSLLPRAACVVGLAAAGCAEDVALSVGEASFAPSELLGLSDSQLSLLTAITALGLATAGGDWAGAGEPILAEARDELLVQRLREETALEARGITETNLEARYAENPDHELTVRHLVILSERWRPQADRDRARSRTEQALERARAGEPFPELAGEVSDEPGAEARGGLLDPGREGSWVDEFWNAASALEVGAVSGVVETEYGFHVLRLDAREPVPFAEARSRVVAEVAAEIDDPAAWRTRITDWTGAEPGDGGMSPAVRELLLAEAARRGLSVTEADEARILREWEFRGGGWAVALGFRQGMTPDAVAAQALVALGSTDQAARIARDEILETSAALRAAYAVQVPDR